MPYDNERQYPVTEGRLYSVVAMQAVTDSVEYLIHADISYPIFIPAAQFSVVHPRVPPWWVFNFWGFPNENYYRLPIARWGYSEVVMDRAHHEAVIDGHPEAEAIYLRNLGISEEFDRKTFWE
nr:hypothetical protein [Microbacterium testaceum]